MKTQIIVNWQWSGIPMDQSDFPNIYSDCKEMVWNLTSRYVDVRSDREDLLQEIFLKVHKALHGFRGDSNVKTWVYRIAVNTCINYAKKQSRYKKLSDIFKKFRFLEDAPQEKEEPRALFKPLKKLNSRQKMILLLSDVEEKKIEEIADLMNIPPGTVKSNLHRAREIIKKEVRQNGEL